MGKIENVMPFEWEEIYREDYQLTCRAMVRGGWLIRHIDSRGETEVASNMIFLPDQGHDWEPE